MDSTLYFRVVVASASSPVVSFPVTFFLTVVEAYKAIEFTFFAAYVESVSS